MFSRAISDSSLTVRECSIDYGKLKTRGDESKYSSLMPWQIPQVSKIFVQMLSQFKIGYIVDACAHIGCDAINFAACFPMARISAIELCEETYKCLSYNVGLLEKYAPDSHWRMDVYNGNAIKLVPELCAESLKNHPNCPIMVYFDPPCGGRNYKDEGDGVNLWLTVGSTYISSLYKKDDKKCEVEILEAREVLNVSLDLLRKNYCTVVVIKVPYNYTGLSNMIDGAFMRTSVEILKSDGRRVDYVLIFLAKR